MIESLGDQHLNIESKIGTTVIYLILNIKQIMQRKTKCSIMTTANDYL